MPDGSPQSNNGSIAIKANTWYCVEFHLSSSSGQIETWVDGKVVPSLTTPQTRWGSSYKPRVSDWGLGWESYGSARNTGTSILFSLRNISDFDRLYQPGSMTWPYRTLASEVAQRHELQNFL
jgi:hypothetical protein